MAKKKILWGILAISLVFVIMSIGCSSGSGGEKKAVEKTLVITGLTGSSIEEVEVILEDIAEMKEIAFGYWDSDEDYAKRSGATYTFKLYSDKGKTKWTGSGSYHVWLATYDGKEGKGYLTKSKHNFSSASTTVSFKNFEIYDE